MVGKSDPDGARTLAIVLCLGVFVAGAAIIAGALALFFSLVGI